MSDVQIREMAVTMSMVDGDVLTPAQMARIIAAVLNELRRQDEDQRRRREDTVIAGSSARGSDGRPQ
ncbi:MAG: hypothetical protein ABI409_13790 [Ramlibacter sp.]